MIMMITVVFFFKKLLDNFRHRMSIRISTSVLLNQIILFILYCTKNCVNIPD